MDIPMCLSSSSLPTDCRSSHLRLAAGTAAFRLRELLTLVYPHCIGLHLASHQLRLYGFSLARHPLPPLFFLLSPSVFDFDFFLRSSRFFERGCTCRRFLTRFPLWSRPLVRSLCYRSLLFSQCLGLGDPKSIHLELVVQRTLLTSVVLLKLRCFDSNFIPALLSVVVSLEESMMPRSNQSRKLQEAPLAIQHPKDTKAAGTGTGQNIGLGGWTRTRIFVRRIEMADVDPQRFLLDRM
ncbi:hypothetical protein EI94DRAFT_1096911 [Lactarius quietus]|nr:hypothetical protein EI94DRAFT_1096911 [Lactarius quietus]